MTGPAKRLMRLNIPLTLRCGSFVDTRGRTVQRPLRSLTVVVERRQAFRRREVRIRLLWP